MTSDQYFIYGAFVTGFVGSIALALYMVLYAIPNWTKKDHDDIIMPGFLGSLALVMFWLVWPVLLFSTLLCVPTFLIARWIKNHKEKIAKVEKILKDEGVL